MQCKKNNCNFLSFILCLYSYSFPSSGKRSIIIFIEPDEGRSCCKLRLYFPKSLIVKFVLDVTACLDQESEATQNFSMRYSRGKPPVFLDFPQESLQPLAVTFDITSRSWQEMEINQDRRNITLYLKKLISKCYV